MYLINFGNTENFITLDRIEILLNYFKVNMFRPHKNFLGQQEFWFIDTIKIVYYAQAYTRFFEQRTTYRHRQNYSAGNNAKMSHLSTFAKTTCQTERIYF